MKPFRLLLCAGMCGLAVTTYGQLGGLDKFTKKLNQAKQAFDTGTKVAKVVGGIGPEEEKVIGDSVALEIISRYGGLIRDDAMMHRVNLVGRSLARYSDRPELAWRFGVLDSDSVNAFSAPAGYVFITRGLYDLATSDDHLAGILAHEISHITKKHALSVVRMGEASSLVSDELTKRSADVRQAQAVAGQVKSTVATVSPEAAKFVDLNTKAVTDLLFVKGFDKPTEYAADAAGHDLAAMSGYAPGGLRAVLVALQGSKADSKKIFSTHPPIKDRLAKLPDDPAPAAQ